jgi:hypothetical protein
MSKVKIQGNASGTGTLTISAPNTNTDRSLTLPDGAGEILLSDGDGSNLTGITTGKVLQVLSANKTDVFTTSSSSYVDVTDLTVSITPSSTSSKVLIIYGVFVSNGTAGYLSPIQIVRGSTAINVSTGSTNNTTGWHQASVNYDSTVVAGSYLDSPSTTSATTYKVQIKNTGGTPYINRRGESSNWGAVSNITVMEIGA